MEAKRAESPLEAGGRLQSTERVSMRGQLRVISAAVAFAAGIAAAPALAQDAAATAAPPATAPADSGNAVGPAQLRDFSLSGTVTKRADTPAPSQTPAQPPVAAATRPAPAEPPAIASETPSVPVRANPAPRPAPSAPAAAQTASTAANAFDFPPPTPAQEPSAGYAAAQVPQGAASPAADTAAAAAAEGGGFIAYWPWLLALLAAAGAAAWYFRRPRTGFAFAGADGNAQFDLSPPAPRPAPPRAEVPPPAPRPAPPRPAPQPAPAPRAPEPALTGVVSTRLRAAPELEAPPPPPPPASPGAGVVSTRLRPWLDIDFAPIGATIDDKEARIEFEIVVFNSGSAPAREVLIEALLFNAGPDQDQAIGAFFAKTGGSGEAVTVIPPLQRMAFRSAVSVSRAQMRIFEAAGRQVFVPLIGFNAFYRWSGGEGQTSASYLIGRGTNGEKMAPFHIDRGPRTFKGLGAREHAVRVRR